MRIEHLPPLADDALRQRVILVTGAGDGLGKATALRLARAGATVVLLGRTVAKLEAVFDAIVAAGGAEPAIYPMDLAGASDRDIHECIERIAEACGGLHGIVHAAAHWREFRPMQEVLSSDWASVLQANLTAPWALTRAALPLLASHDDACVVFCSCECGTRPHAYYGAYGVAKFGLEGMVRGWVAEQPGVRMHLFDPGPMRTRIRLLGYPGQPADDLPLPAQAAEALSALLSPACAAEPAVAGQLSWAAGPLPATGH